MKQHKAFTLIELLISIFLLGLIVNFLYSAIGNLQKTNTIFKKKSTTMLNEQKVLDLLYDDIFLAKTMEIEGLKNSVLSLQTSNSLYDIEYPYVTWLIGKKEETLLRFESTLDFSKMTTDNANLFHISNAGENCENFHIYQSKNRDNILIHVKFKDAKPLVYEFFKPLSQHRDNNESNKTKNDLNQTTPRGQHGSKQTTPNRSPHR
jgi:prepilin-type N-terminal cleavage/methylation domain-containing protein